MSMHTISDACNVHETITCDVCLSTDAASIDRSNTERASCKHEGAHLFEVESASGMWRGFGGATAASDTWVPCHTSCKRHKPSLPDFGFPTTKSVPPACGWPESRNFPHLGKFAVQNDRTLQLLQRVTCKALLLGNLSKI